MIALHGPRVAYPVSGNKGHGTVLEALPIIVVIVADTIPRGCPRRGRRCRRRPPPRASLSPHTRRAYAGALRRLDAWLAGRELNDSHLAPTSPICSEAGRAASSASMSVAAARFRARLAGEPDPAGAATELTARGASTHDVMRAGNWKTVRMVAHYSAGASAELGAVARYL